MIRVLPANHPQQAKRKGVLFQFSPSRTRRDGEVLNRMVFITDFPCSSAFYLTSSPA